MTGNSLLAVVSVSALLFGAVESWSMAIVGVITTAAFVPFVGKWKSSGESGPDTRGIILPALIHLLYPLFQLIPLPLSVLNVFHVKLRELVTLSPDLAPAFHSISVYPFATETELSHLMVYLMVFSMAAFGIRDRHRAFRLMRGLMIFGFVIGIFGIIQRATSNESIYWFRKLSQGGIPFGPFVNRNHFAGFLGMIIPFSVAFASMARSLEKRVMYGFFGIIMAVALFFSLSRGGIISFFGGILVFLFLVFTKGKSRMKLAPLFIFLFFFAVYLVYLGASPVIERFAKSGVTDAQRLSAWVGTLTAFRDFPLFGSGMGTFPYIFKIYQPEGLPGFWDHAHNDYLELLLEGGIIGVLVLAVFMLSILIRILKAPWDERGTYLGAAFLSSITTMAVHSIVDFNLHIPSNAILFSLILGLAANMSRGELQKETEKDRHR
jgi:O-antigen ligase